VYGLLVQNLARIKVIVNDMSVVGGNNQRLVARTPHSSGKQVVFASLNFLDFFDFGANLHAFLNSGKEVFEIVNADVGAFFVIKHAEELLIAKSEFDLLRVKTWHPNLSSKFASSSIIEVNAHSGGSSYDVFCVFGKIDRPAGLVDLEHANTHQLVGVVHTDKAIVRAGEQTIAIVVVHDLVDRTRVASEVDWLHWGNHIVLKIINITAIINQVFRKYVLTAVSGPFSTEIFTFTATLGSQNVVDIV
jgi:hypothetical protein